MWQTGQRITRDPHRDDNRRSRSSAQRTKTPSHETSSVTLEDRSRLVKRRETVFPRQFQVAIKTEIIATCDGPDT